MKTSKGVTLLELIIVMVIVGILASVAIPVYDNLAEEKRLDTAENNLKAISIAERFWFLGDGDSTFTDALTDLTLDIASLNNDSNYDYFVDISTSTAYAVDEGGGIGGTRVLEIDLNTGAFL